eukprot:14433072-Heterocapsa_arctica.AAC.1
MPLAAAAVAMDVPFAGQPTYLDEKGLENLLTAVINGPRQTSANSEFRRKIKENLQHRFKWDTRTVEDKVKRAKDGCSRWYPGRKFPSWKYDPERMGADPGRDGY